MYKSNEFFIFNSVISITVFINYIQHTATRLLNTKLDGLSEAFINYSAENVQEIIATGLMNFSVIKFNRI